MFVPIILYLIKGECTMPKPSDKFAPYASFGNINIILKKIRKGWTPAQIDPGDLERVGITKSNLSRVMATLEFLGLIFDAGTTNETTWKAIATATEAEYPQVLEGILRSAYSNIFELYPDPSEANDVQLTNAFRKNEPLAQLGRMVSLFRGLCQEAGLITGEPLTRDRKSSEKQSKNGNEKKAEIEKVKEIVPERINLALKWYKDLEPLMSRLPKSERPDEKPKWTLDEKQRWFAALQAMLDYLIDED
jgi:uncharacterized protein DUF5343